MANRDAAREIVAFDLCEVIVQDFIFDPMKYIIDHIMFFSQGATPWVPMQFSSSVLLDILHLTFMPFMHASWTAMILWCYNQYLDDW